MIHEIVTIQKHLPRVSGLDVVEYFYGHWRLVIFSFKNFAEFIFLYRDPIRKLLLLNLLGCMF